MEQTNTELFDLKASDVQKLPLMVPCKLVRDPEVGLAGRAPTFFKLTSYYDKADDEITFKFVAGTDQTIQVTLDFSKVQLVSNLYSS